MWRGVFPGRAEDEVPIGHVTNGVHVPTWMASPMRELLDAHLGPGWTAHMHDPSMWAAVDAIPDNAEPLPGAPRVRPKAVRLIRRGSQTRTDRASAHSVTPVALRATSGRQYDAKRQH
jgi:starch phosphorylase